MGPRFHRRVAHLSKTTRGAAASVVAVPKVSQPPARNFYGRIIEFPYREKTMVPVPSVPAFVISGENNRASPVCPRIPPVPASPPHPRPRIPPVPHPPSSIETFSSSNALYI